MTVLGLMRDLMFRSRLDSAADALGVEVGYAGNLAVVTARCAELKPDLVVVDLSEAGFPPRETLAAVKGGAPDARVIGFASHVDLKTIGAAREAGFERVLSRQEFVSRLPALLKSGESRA
jgi:DNA-binding NarL/FixJ family response regulator